MKLAFAKEGIAVSACEASMKWADFKLNSDEMLPVVVQDYKTNEVLMVAYMNEEAYNMTIASGKMTYYSRSRNELWIKALTVREDDESIAFDVNDVSKIMKCVEEDGRTSYLIKRDRGTLLIFR